MPSYRWFCVGAALLSASCVIEVNTEPRLAPPTEEEIWEQHFNDIVDDFNAGAKLFADDVGTMSGAGARFFWLSSDPQLHSYDVLSTSRVDYELPLTPDVYPDLAFGADAVVTAEYSSGNWQISAYAAAEPSALIAALLDRGVDELETVKRGLCYAGAAGYVSSTGTRCSPANTGVAVVSG